MTAQDGELEAFDEVTVSVQPEPQLTDGLVGAWLFDELAGSVAVDASGLGNDGSLQGNPTRIDGQVAGGLYFDGSDDRVLIADHPSLDLQNAITIAAWLKPEREATQYVISKATKSEIN